jgi:hypothetical protein
MPISTRLAIAGASLALLSGCGSGAHRSPAGPLSATCGQLSQDEQRAGRLDGLIVERVLTAHASTRQQLYLAAAGEIQLVCGGESAGFRPAAAIESHLRRYCDAADPTNHLVPQARPPTYCRDLRR